MPSWLYLILGAAGTGLVLAVLRWFSPPWKKEFQGLMTKKQAKKARKRVEKTLAKDMDAIDKMVEEGKSRAEAVLAKITLKKGEGK